MGVSDSVVTLQPPRERACGDGEPNVRAPPRWPLGEEHGLQGRAHNLGRWVSPAMKRESPCGGRAPTGEWELPRSRQPGLRGVGVGEQWVGRGRRRNVSPRGVYSHPPPNTPKNRNHVMSGGPGQCQEDSLVLRRQMSKQAVMLSL